MQFKPSLNCSLGILINLICLRLARFCRGSNEHLKCEPQLAEISEYFQNRLVTLRVKDDTIITHFYSKLSNKTENNPCVFVAGVSKTRAEEC